MLDSFKLEKAPDTVFCIPNFVTEQEEENTLRNIHKAPKPKWTNLLNRRLQNWGGLPKPKVHNLSKDQLISKCPFDVFESSKKNRNLFQDFCPSLFLT